MNKKKLYRMLLILYSALMCWLLFNRPGYDPAVPYWEQVSRQLNLVPFRTLRLFVDLLDSGVRSHMMTAIINLGGNIIMFIPLGLLLPNVFPKLSSLPRVLLATAGIIVAVEVIQLFTLVGSCDIDDLILNVPGAGLGYLIHSRIQKAAI